MHDDLILSMKDLYNLCNETTSISSNVYLIPKDSMSKIPVKHLNYLHLEYLIKIDLVDDHYMVELPVKEDK